MYHKYFFFKIILIFMVTNDGATQLTFFYIYDKK